MRRRNRFKKRKKFFKKGIRRRFGARGGIAFT